MKDSNISIIETDKATIITVPKHAEPEEDSGEASVSFADLTGVLADDPELEGKTALEVEKFAHDVWSQATKKEHNDTHTS
jgi:hypothetical protein